MLKRINDENKKTREILERIDKGEFKKDGKSASNIKSYIVKTRETDMEVKKESEREEETGAETG